MRQQFLPMKLWVLTLVVAFSVTSCLGTREWTYPPPPNSAFLGIQADQPVSGSLVVLPLVDQRGKEEQEEYWKIAIPLVPSGVTFYDRPEDVKDPEQIDEIDFNPPEDFARALSDEIREAKIFSSVAYAEKSSAPSTEYVLQGRLHSTRWERSITTYLLGPLGTIFWMVGLPMGQTDITVEMDLQLTAAADPSKVLWSFSMEFQGWDLDGIYYGLANEVNSYPTALQEALRPAITDLADKAASRLATS
ncbi:MAG: hypothetical protein VST68_00750 [Nitrospirota bacterium]|nr:hypothetical protein [Nitrospirota bacterium]